MANTTPSSLFRIDPTQGLVDYVNTVKPYHTKILDILTEYVYTENISVTVKDKWFTDVGLMSDDIPLTYNCNPIITWDSVRSSDSHPPSKILFAQSTEDSTDLSPANTFLVERNLGSEYNITVINSKSNQLAFVNVFDIIGVTPLSNEWIISGDITPLINNGDVFYIKDNTELTANISYIIDSYFLLSGNTHVITTESISLLAQPNGTANIPLSADNVPLWSSNLAVELTTTGVLPLALVGITELYYITTDQAGIFNLSTRRYPHFPEDYIDLTDIGVGDLLIKRKETFYPGASVIITGSYLKRNDSRYTVIKTISESTYDRVYVYEKIPMTTPSSLSIDGAMLFDFTNRPPAFCPVSSTPEMHAATYIHERLTFQFEDVKRDTISNTVSETQYDVFNPAPSSYSLYRYGGFAHNAGTFVQSELYKNVPTYTLLPHGFELNYFDIGAYEENTYTANLSSTHEGI